jgi:hypothetical protein
MYYADILKLDIYECTRGTESIECNNLSKSYKPEIRTQRQFNIAKKKENEVKPLSGDQKYRLNKARLEMLVDIALEEGNKEDFIKFSSKLKKYYAKEVGV